MKSLLLVLSSALLLFVSCSTPGRKQEDQSNVARNLSALADRFSEAYMAGDVEAMMALYTGDAAIAPGNSEYITGADAIRRYWTLPPGRVITHHRQTSLDLRVSGDLATDYGQYEISGENDGEPWGPVYGKYILLWRRDADSNWRIFMDMWNSRPQ